ncbi:MAG TPA: prephenate dehydratase domain-containing protein [Microbacteriaceae bacterium]|nr:prephenate dehydratase domain-containing protein [Microbacteriaceae bacterium]
MSETEQPDGGAPALIVVGAALGTGRWLAEHLLPHADWSSVTLIDSKTTKTSQRSQQWRLAARAPIVYGESVETPDGDRLVLEGSTAPLPLPTGPTVAWFALPEAVLVHAVVETLPLLSPDTTVLVSAARLSPAIEVARDAAAGREVVGVHPLFDASMPSLAGQILYVVPAADPAGRNADPTAPPEAPAWLAAAIASAGGILKTGSAEQHDRTMELVQDRAHRVLTDLAAEVVGSELDLERDIWEARTPLFETLFGLAVRALDSRESTVDPGELAAIRARFPGSLYDTIRGTAAAAVTAAQSKRLALAHLRRSGQIVGLRTLGDHRVRIGRIVELTSTTVSLEELVVGPAGRAALLDGVGLANAAKLGISGRPRRTTFGLGHVDPITGGELESALDARLAHLRRDVRFLVPESVAGAGVLQVVRVHQGLRDVELVDEVVRTGQRSVVVRMGIRADLDPAEVVDWLQRQVAEAYTWPSGLVRRPAHHVERVVYLGPAGTFSEDAAGRAAAALQAPGAALEALGGFPEVLAALAPGTVGVLPVTSSASGLVSRAIAALLTAGRPIAAGGMVDVPVRFDAYARPGIQLEALRGAPAFSHPQAIAQCAAFIRRTGLVAVPVESTAAALEHAAAHEGAAVALAGVDKGAAHGLHVIDREIDDLSGSITRFLVVGGPDAFGEPRPGSQPTLRRLWIGEDPADALPLLAGAGFSELLTDADGRWLLVTSIADAPTAASATLLGDVPWSPRTPVVRTAP